MNDTGGSDIIEEVMYIKAEYKVDEHEVKSEIEQSAEKVEGIKDEVASDVYHNNPKIEEIYIKSEPVDTSEYEDELENAAVPYTESRDTRKTCILSSVDDISQYNYNTNIIITEEIDIKSECKNASEYESVPRQDTDLAASSDNLHKSWVPVSINKFKQINAAQTLETCYKCDACEKTFAKSQDLVAHKSVHVGDKPFICDQCNKAFSKMPMLIIHKRIHSGEKPFTCDQCNKAFAQISNLNRHKRIHSGEKPFKCDQCNKEYSDPSSLISHKRIHSGEKPFQCDQCNKAFSCTSHLIRHKRIHSGEKPFKCEQCNKAFTRSESLDYHKRIHSGEKRIKCNK